MNPKQRMVRDRLIEAGYDLAAIASAARGTVEDIVDVAVKVYENGARQLVGGFAMFTGNNRTYANGAVGYEVRCAACRRTFWVTNVPYATCVDCGNNVFQGM